MGGVENIVLPVMDRPLLHVRVAINRNSAEMVRRIQAGVGNEHLTAWLEAIGEGEL